MSKISRSKVAGEEETHTQRAYLALRQMLFHKEIVPGQRVGSRELTERLEMSATPVIQALKWLEFQGLLRHEPNRGYFVAPIDLEEIEEIYDLRELIEISLLPQVIERLDRDGERKLRAALKAHLNAKREAYLNERILRDAEFHLAVAALARRPLHQKMLRSLLDLLCLKYRGGFQSATSIESTDQEHRQLCEAIISRDLPGATRTLAGHIRNVKQRVCRSFQRIQEEKEDSRLLPPFRRLSP